MHGQIGFPPPPPPSFQHHQSQKVFKLCSTFGPKTKIMELTWHLIHRISKYLQKYKWWRLWWLNQGGGLDPGVPSNIKFDWIYENFVHVFNISIILSVKQIYDYGHLIASFMFRSERNKLSLNIPIFCAKKAAKCVFNAEIISKHLENKLLRLSIKTNIKIRLEHETAG